MRYGSVCSGIEAASVAWASLGWSAAWFAEIASFPSKVLAHRFPEVRNHGSLIGLSTRLVGADDAIDALVGGTPCQGVSIAGKGRGLGPLPAEYCRVAKALRPRWVLWENVPNVLSAKHARDFAALVGALVQLGYGCAWRVLDARYAGVPQRRRRVFLVASARGAAAAGAVLFEPEGVRRDSPPSSEAGEEVAGTPGGGSGSRGWAPDTDRMTFIPEAAKCLTTSAQRIDTETETFVATCFDPTQVTSRTNRSSCDGRTAASARPPHIAFNARQDPLTYGEGTGPLDTDGSTYAVCVTGEQTHALRSIGSDASEDGTGRGTPITTTQTRVRRLTPRECERLQGFPDDFTAIPGAKDGPRYAALGNSMAVPVMRWIGQRIALVDSILEAA